MTAYTPTDEQLSALTMAMTGDSFKIVAYAGAGKTTTLKLISENVRQIPPKRQMPNLSLTRLPPCTTEYYCQSESATDDPCQIGDGTWFEWH